MVFISAICFHPNRNGYGAYLKKRFIRIYKPVCVFLIVFFIISYIGSYFIPQLNFDYTKIIGSFLLLNKPSIGYVWIMRVFLMAAVILPLIYDYIKRFSSLNTLIVTLSIFLLSECLNHSLSFIEQGWLKFILSEYILYIIAYSYIIIWGLTSANANKSILLLYLCSIAIIYLAYCIYKSEFIFDPTLSKYPPHGFYLLYGAFISVLFWLVKPHNTIKLPLMISYLSRESMWLYLWHIIPAYAIIPFIHIADTWFLRFCFVVVSMVTITYCYKKATGKIQWLQ